MNHCPRCKGTGKINFTLTTYGSDVVEHSQLNCIDCDGGKNPFTLEESIKYNKQLEKQKKLFCNCENVGTNVTFVDNNVSKVCKKHHWIHNTCKKIVQIG